MRNQNNSPLNTNLKPDPNNDLVIKRSNSKIDKNNNVGANNIN